ncbi:hypothetical protein DVA67_027800 [Solirubrobacter sp. CPCC 204708]|uniref:Uncharacterized protein n=1 Tax=Solirubrobacter deserti TaxID=2282478 RepID=A0ABT4RJI4_9ACTN|nr:hypothetical protein [Solirubrobacter deserti]MBE2319800.1 hypothetical protein [Solirubrobacter deserti]MDA0138717.1 hypothetical protein [Solirubrobacter deserti]
MNHSEELLLHQSVDHLFAARWAVESAFSGSSDALTEDEGRDLGFSFFNAVNGLLKSAIDLADEATFATVERKWEAMFDEVWLPAFPHADLAHAFNERRGGEVQSELLALLRRREILRFGLAMWVVHLLERPQPVERSAFLHTAFGVLASQFPNVEWVLDAYDASTAAEESDKPPWTMWFLAELPDEAAHFIPTSEKLLLTALLLCTRLVAPGEPSELRPRDWFEWRHEEIQALLGRLVQERDRWQPVLGVADAFDTTSTATPPDPERGWSQRLDRLATLLASGREAQQDVERERVRNASIDETRLDEVRQPALRSAAEYRVLRDTLALQGNVNELREPPPDNAGLVAYNWAPKSFFVSESGVLGLDMMGRDLARSARTAEAQQLFAALPDVASSLEQGDLRSALSKTIEGMRTDGFHPSLIVLPINWQVERELGLTAFGATPVQHQTVPPSHQRDFCGIFEDVAAIDFAGAPDDRVWVLDLREAIRFDEWPSDSDSGVRLEFRSFDEASAAGFLSEHPEIRKGRTSEEAVRFLLERVLITMRLCWRITGGNPRAARALEIPEELRRGD